MTKSELTDELAAICDGSGLSVADKVAALRVALTRVQMNVSSLGLHAGQRQSKPAPRKLLLRPSGKMMGKVKREAKSE